MPSPVSTWTGRPRARLGTLGAVGAGAPFVGVGIDDFHVDFRRRGALNSHKAPRRGALSA